MTRRARSLLLYASGMPRARRVVADTVRRFIPLRDRVASALRWNRYARFFFANEYESLSYVIDWYDAFVSNGRISATTCNVNDAIALAAAMRKIREFDLVIVLHSAAGDSMSRLDLVVGTLSRRSAPMLVLFGNEYSLMGEKRAFLKASAAEYVGTQLPRQAAEWLYKGCGARVLEAPAALNPSQYRPGLGDRPIDIGFRGDRYRAELVGDRERAALIEHFERSRSHVLRVDIAYHRVARSEWSAFLSRCSGTIGAESGTYYLERDDATQGAVRSFLADVPNATFDEVHRRFWLPKSGGVSGKAISSRHFEAAGTKTCQILIEGEYNGILRGDQHFIPVRRDLSDVESATRRFMDVAERQGIADRAYEHIMSAHTYAHRVDSLLREVIG
jgi:hypothetical protein